MGLKDLVMVIILGAALYSLKDDTVGILSCGITDYTCIFPSLLKFALVLSLLYVATKVL